MTVLNHLTDTAARLLARGPSVQDITTSLQTLKNRVNSYFSSGSIRGHFQFGSWQRKTSLPRQADQYADVDYMIVFYGDESSRPQTLLDRVRRFVEQKYSTSEIKQSHPTILLTLNHIQFELVPAIRSYNLDYGSLLIPAPSSSYTDWLRTDPSAADASLERHNGDSAFLSKPLIRILKYWNCQADPYPRPYASYEIEQIVQQQYCWPSNSLKDFFYSTVANLPVAWDHAIQKKDRIERLKSAVRSIKQNEVDGLPITAAEALKKIIPEF